MTLNTPIIYNILPYHTIPYHTISYYTIPYLTIPNTTIPNQNTRLCGNTSHLEYVVAHGLGGGVVQLEPGAVEEVLVEVMEEAEEVQVEDEEVQMKVQVQVNAGLVLAKCKIRQNGQTFSNLLRFC